MNYTKICFSSSLSLSVQASSGPKPDVHDKQHVGCLQKDSHGSLVCQPVAGRLG